MPTSRVKRQGRKEGAIQIQFSRACLLASGPGKQKPAHSLAGFTCCRRHHATAGFDYPTVVTVGGGRSVLFPQFCPTNFMQFASMHFVQTTVPVARFHEKKLNNFTEKLEIQYQFFSFRSPILSVDFSANQRFGGKVGPKRERCGMV